MNNSSNSCNQIRKSKIIFDITPTQKKDIHSRAYSTEMIIIGLKNLLTSFTLAYLSLYERHQPPCIPQSDILPPLPYFRKE